MPMLLLHVRKETVLRRINGILVLCSTFFISCCVVGFHFEQPLGRNMLLELFYPHSHRAYKSLRPSDAYICVCKLIIIGSDSGLSPRRRQAIIWSIAGISLLGPLGTKFSDILIVIFRVSFKKMPLKGSSAKWQPFCFGLNVIMG